MNLTSYSSLEELAFDCLIDSGGNKFIAIKELLQKGTEKKEAIEIVNRTYKNIDGYSEKSSITFKEFSEIWVNDYAEVRLKKSTYTSNLRNLRKNLSYFDELSLDQITNHIIQRWISRLSENLAPKTVKNNYSLLHQILDQAVVWGFLKANPAVNIVLPKVEKKEAKYYEEDEVMKLMQVLEKVPEQEYDYKVAVLLALFGGLRKGEICGLDYSDIDFKNNKIHIRKSRLTNKGEGVYEDSPKTKQSVRTISISVEVIDELKKLTEIQELRKKAQGYNWIESPALLKSRNGKPIYPQNLYRWFRRLQQKNGLPEMPLHGLRHTHTAMLVNSGNDIEAVSHRLGHSTTTITLGTYSHLFQPSDEEIALKLSERFFKPKE